MAAMKLAGRYAYAGRDYVVGQVLRTLWEPRPRSTCTTTTTSPGYEEHGGEQVAG